MGNKNLLNGISYLKKKSQIKIIGKKHRFFKKTENKVIETVCDLEYRLEEII